MKICTELLKKKAVVRREYATAYDKVRPKYRRYAPWYQGYRHTQIYNNPVIAIVLEVCSTPPPKRPSPTSNLTISNIEFKGLQENKNYIRFEARGERLLTKQGAEELAKWCKSLMTREGWILLTGVSEGREWKMLSYGNTYRWDPAKGDGGLVAHWLAGRDKILEPYAYAADDVASDHLVVKIWSQSSLKQ